MAISVRRKCARNIPRTIIPRKLKGPPNDPPLFSSFLSLLFQLFPSFPLSLSLSLVPQRIGIRGANLGGGGPRGEVGQSGGNGGAGQKVGGRRFSDGQRNLQLLHGQAPSLGIGQFTSYSLDGVAQGLSSLGCMVSSI